MVAVKPKSEPSTCLIVFVIQDSAKLLNEEFTKTLIVESELLQNVGSVWPDLVVLVSLKAVDIYSDRRFSISATRIHARPCRAMPKKKGKLQINTIHSESCHTAPPMKSSRLGSGGADVLDVFDAGDAAVLHLAARQPDVFPETALSIRAEPASRTWDQKADVHGQGADGRPSLSVRELS